MKRIRVLEEEITQLTDKGSESEIYKELKDLEKQYQFKSQEVNVLSSKLRHYESMSYGGERGRDKGVIDR